MYSIIVSMNISPVSLQKQFRYLSQRQHLRCFLLSTSYCGSQTILFFTIRNRLLFYYETRMIDMVDSQDVDKVFDRVATPDERGESSKHKRKQGPTEMKEITRVRSEGRRLVIEYNELGQPIG